MRTSAAGRHGEQGCLTLARARPGPDHEMAGKVFDLRDKAMRARQVVSVLLTFAALLAVALAGPAQAPNGGTLGARGRPHALLVGVSDYDPRHLHRLPFSRHDVTELHKA